MTQHYSRTTVEVSEWCKKCGRFTRHRVYPPKLGPCLECLERPSAPKIEPPAEQLTMFANEKPLRDPG